MKGKPIQIIEEQPKDSELPKYRECIQSAYHAVDREGKKVLIKEILDDLKTANKVIELMIVDIECPYSNKVWLSKVDNCHKATNCTECASKYYYTKAAAK